jgi:type IV pilus assembly protein PilY1
LTGSGSTGRASSTAHGYSSGRTIFISGANESPFNTPSGATISVIDPNTFTYTLTGTATGLATGTTILAKVPIKYITHPSSGGSQDIATVTLYSSHSWPNGLSLFITGTGAAGYEAATTARSISNVNQAASTFQLAARVGNEIKNAPTCLKASAADANPTGFSSCTVVAGMFAGRQITALVPVVQATGTVYAAKSINVSALSPLTNATGAITAGRIIDSSTTVRDAIIAWVRGADNRDDENPATTPAGSDIRPSVHGDVLHSRPAVVNYNRYGDDEDIYAFYGGNDGIFRAVKGGILAHTSGPDTAILPGMERWGFIPREFLGKLKRLREQSPTISNLNQKDYFADGSIGVYQKDVPGTGSVASPGAGTVMGVIGDNSGDKVHLYMSLRRGGDFIYALDATNPANPKLLWRKGFGDAGWEQLGQTWSEPRVAKVRVDLGNTNNPDNVVLIFGAGYDDTVEDLNHCLLNKSTLTGVEVKAIGSGTVTYTSSGTCTITGATGSATSVSRTRGRGILVVDAFSGNVVWQAGSAVTTSTGSTSNPTVLPRKLSVSDMSCAIPSDVTVLDKNRDGFADRVYTGDTCGQVWRVDLSSTNIDDWVVTKIANLSSSTDTDIANKRKFLFPPDLVFATDSSNYTAVLLGSGDREHPFSTVVSNRFYMLKDRDASSGSPQAGATNSTSVSINGITPSPTGSPFTDGDLFDATNVIVDGSDPSRSGNGWKITMATGEKIVSSATTMAGTTYFNTNQPSSAAGGGACGSNLGIAREYQINFADASATTDLNAVGGITIADRSTIHAGGGYLPSPVPVVVEIDGQKYQAVISGTSVQTPPGLTLEKRTRSYWYKELD